MKNGSTLPSLPQWQFVGWEDQAEQLRLSSESANPWWDSENVSITNTSSFDPNLSYITGSPQTYNSVGP